MRHAPLAGCTASPRACLSDVDALYTGRKGTKTARGYFFTPLCIVGSIGSAAYSPVQSCAVLYSPLQISDTRGGSHGPRYADNPHHRSCQPVAALGMVG